MDEKNEKYIVNHLNVLENARLTNAVIAVFNKMIDIKDGQGCAMYSFILKVIFKYFGIESEVKYGLCYFRTGKEAYHAWLDVYNKVIDIAIYGNSRYNPAFMAIDEKKYDVVIMEDYNEALIKYTEDIDEDVNASFVPQLVNGSKKYYLNMPKELKETVKNIICSCLGISITTKNLCDIEQIIKRFSN